MYPNLNPINKVVAWANDTNQRTNPSTPSLQDIVPVSHDGAWREEIEID